MGLNQVSLSLSLWRCVLYSDDPFWRFHCISHDIIIEIIDIIYTIVGPEEDSPRDMECLDFVTHSPQSASFLPSLSRDSDVAMLWTGSKRRRIMFTS